MGVIPSGQENHSRAEHLNFPDQFGFHEMEGEIFKPQIYILPQTAKTPYGTIEAILVFEKQRVNPWDWMVYFEKIKYSK